MYDEELVALAQGYHSGYVTLEMLQEELSPDEVAWVIKYAYEHYGN